VPGCAALESNIFIGTCFIALDLVASLALCSDNSLALLEAVLTWQQIQHEELAYFSER